MAIPQAYLTAVQAASQKYGVPAEVLAAQIQAESGWNPNAKSPAGAVGISQFMPGTAKGMGLKNPLDPIASIDAQGRMMGRLLKSYGGNVDKALAAYNAGSGAVAKYGGVPPFSETHHYIQNIHNYEKNYPGLASGKFGGGGVTEPTITGQIPSKPSETVLQTLSANSEGSAQANKSNALQGLLQYAMQGSDPGSSGKAERSSLFHLLAAQDGEPVTMPTISPTPQDSVVPATQGGQATPTAQSGATVTVDGHTLDFTPGKSWAGTEQIADQFRDLAKSYGLKVMSEKRATVHTKSGGVSDHWVGNKTAYAFDMSNSPYDTATEKDTTPEMAKYAAEAAAALGVLDQWKKQGSKGVINVTKNGYRYQMLYRTTVGGNHYNHVHLGVKKV